MRQIHSLDLVSVINKLIRLKIAHSQKYFRTFRSKENYFSAIFNAQVKIGVHKACSGKHF